MSARLIGAALVMMLALSACGFGPIGNGGAAASTGGGSIDITRNVADDEQDTASLADAVNALGFDLHRGLLTGTGDTNVVTSPLSISVLLAMVAAGADGQTATELVDVLGVDSVRDGRYAALLQRVTDTSDVDLSVGNAVWMDIAAALNPEYAEYVRRTFDATVDTLPLGTPAGSEAIDEWVADRTNGRIDRIAADLGLPDGDAELVLANVVHFLGEWTTQFDRADTVDAAFTLPDGREVTVPTMHRRVGGETPVEFAVTEDYSILRLPYGGEDRYAMEVFLPSADSDVPTMLSRLAATTWAAATDTLQPVSRLEIALPRFELVWSSSLGTVLQSLGVSTAFGPDADLSVMSPTNPGLADVVHTTYVRVDEDGTEAAAVTGGAMVVSVPPRFAVDRPFAFTISDRETGTVLFLGSVTDPRGDAG